MDKYLWAIRLFKTRSQAVEACKSGHVKIGGVAVKAAREPQIGEKIDVRVSGFTRTVKVLGLLDKRVSATLAREFVQDLTPPEVYQQQREIAQSGYVPRPRGLGRPTKKDRRDLQKLI